MQKPFLTIMLVVTLIWLAACTLGGIWALWLPWADARPLGDGRYITGQGRKMDYEEGSALVGQGFIGAVSVAGCFTTLYVPAMILLALAGFWAKKQPAPKGQQPKPPALPPGSPHP